MVVNNGECPLYSTRPGIELLSFKLFYFLYLFSSRMAAHAIIKITLKNI